MRQPKNLENDQSQVVQESISTCQLAENTERVLNEIVELTIKTHQTHNAQLSGEQRTDQAAA
ncbi:hypothetical protein [Vibrio aestuarianus]|uniref:hypothetical protein n=1 Tax=Vibrio aestuarianus TaxID=28171 RepID=UPI00237D02AD|nr:hypothetical protein [Vibrio aestuarianus]MDE1266200.1 hypothetical protein [Vibrio aestuarianus]